MPPPTTPIVINTKIRDRSMTGLRMKFLARIMRHPRAEKSGGRTSYLRSARPMWEAETFRQMQSCASGPSKSPNQFDDCPAIFGLKCLYETGGPSNVPWANADRAGCGQRGAACTYCLRRRDHRV